MKQYDHEGITVRTMTALSGFSKPSIHRFLKDKEPIGGKKSQKNQKYYIHDAREVIHNIFAKNYHITKKVMSFYNFKGGTGKTSICYQVSSHLAMMGFKTLVIDADPQGHLSTSLGFDNSQSYLTLFDIIKENLPFNIAVKSVYAGLDCIPANLSLTRIEVALNEMPRREERIRLVIDPILRQYDYIIFDTNPTISNLNRNVLTASDLVNIVCETQPYSLNGLKLLMDDIHSFYRSMNIDPPLMAIIPNKYEDRVSSSGEAMSLLRKNYSDIMKPDFAVRKSEDINIAAKLSLPLGVFAKSNSNAFEDIIEVINYILELTSEKIQSSMKLEAA
jgi:chromosome partitioning protein